MVDDQLPQYVRPKMALASLAATRSTRDPPSSAAMALPLEGGACRACHCFESNRESEVSIFSRSLSVRVRMISGVALLALGLGPAQAQEAQTQRQQDQTQGQQDQAQDQQ